MPKKTEKRAEKKITPPRKKKEDTTKRKISTKKSSKTATKSKSKKTVRKPHLQHGGMSFINDIVLSGKDLINGNKQIFTSIKNLGTDVFCEAQAIKNLPKELDLGFDTKCDFTKTKSWNPKMFEGR
jgi:hypothetical protein